MTRTPTVRYIDLKALIDILALGSAERTEERVEPKSLCTSTDRTSGALAREVHISAET